MIQLARNCFLGLIVLFMSCHDNGRTGKFYEASSCCKNDKDCASVVKSKIFSSPDSLETCLMNYLLETDPTNTRVLFYLGLVKCKLWKLEEARDLFAEHQSKFYESIDSSAYGTASDAMLFLIEDLDSFSIEIGIRFIVENMDSLEFGSFKQSIGHADTNGVMIRNENNDWTLKPNGEIIWTSDTNNQ